MSNGTRVPVSLDPPAGPGPDEPRRVPPDKAWSGSGGREVSLRDDGVITPAKVSPIIESLKNTYSSFGESLRLLGATVLNLRQERGMKCLAVTSALPSDGKTTVSFGLSIALARDPAQRTLLIEADVRRPSLSATLGLPPDPGLAEWLNGAADHVSVRALDSTGLFVLGAGQAGLEQPETLRSKRMEALFRAARVRFDTVVVDTAPVLSVADAVFIQDLVDGFLLVVRSRQTPRNAVRDALARLRPDRVAGIVVNDHREYADSYYTRAYSRYGMQDSRDLGDRYRRHGKGRPR